MPPGAPTTRGGRSRAINSAGVPLEQMPRQEDLRSFYDRSYSSGGDRGLLYARWRTLSAAGKAEHVVSLCARAGISPTRTLEIGCGDGALLAELHARGFGGVLRGVEITQAAVDIAAGRPEIASVELYDGEHLPAGDGEYDLGIASHVLEHVPRPIDFLREMARVCRAQVVEVPLEDTLSADRAVKREHALVTGHLQRLSKASMHLLADQAGLRIVDELDDPLPRDVHTFFAETPRARLAGTGKWLVRSGLHQLSPALAQRMFTLHYACLCLPAT